MKHIYQSIHGWFNFEDFYSYLIDQLPNNFNFAEVGVWKGKSLSYFVIESINKNKSGNIFAIDHWLGSEEHNDPSSPHYEKNLAVSKDSVFNTFIENIYSIKDHITIIRQASEQAYTNFNDQFLDAIFIDGSHDYDSVKKDLNNWYSKIKNGGIISGHDYSWKGVKKAVQEFSQSDVNVLSGCWYFQKKGA